MSKKEPDSLEARRISVARARAIARRVHNLDYFDFKKVSENAAAAAAAADALIEGPVDRKSGKGVRFSEEITEYEIPSRDCSKPESSLRSASSATLSPSSQPVFAGFGDDSGSDSD